ncbi:MAG TPA: DUF5615 family PIN-like protein [Blastocatellia bacterium]|nr:DUF5615 family PIN-like protein [Blastocatellia bacterium]
MLFDENFDHRILRGLRFRLPEAELLTVQEASLSGIPDQQILAWAANEGLILVTHDVQTVPAFAYERLKAGESMAGVFAIPGLMPIGQAIEELVLLTACSEPGEWENRVLHLPL